MPRQRPFSEIDIREYGLVDASDHTAMIEAALQTGIDSNRPVVIPNDRVWVYRGAGFDPSQGDPNGRRWFSVRGLHRHDSKIRVESDAYLFDAVDPLGGFHISNLTLLGGKGLLRHQFDGDNVPGASQRRLWDLDLVGFTECGIQVNAADSPQWSFKDCGFEAASFDDTISIALGDRGNGTIIEACTFARSRYDIKLRSGVDVTIGNGNQFARFAGTGHQGPRANIWLVPDVFPDYGRTLNIIGNKFGNENAAPTDHKILIAAEAPGTDNGTRMPDYSASAPGRVRGLFITRNHFAWGGTGGPAVYSTCGFIDESSWIAGNDYDGSPNTAIVEYAPFLGVSNQGNEWLTMRASDGTYRRLTAVPGGGAATWT